MIRRSVTTAIVLAGLFLAPASAAPAAPGAQGATGVTTRVSVGTGGTQANSASKESAVSADGRYVAFYSSANNLVPGDTNGKQDVFVRDRVTGATTLISVATGGTQANGHSSYRMTISANGRYVAFSSDATNLVSADTNGATDVFVRDRVTGATTRVNVASSGTQSNGYFSSEAAISADGRYVAFSSDASNLVSADTNRGRDVFVHDRVTGATTRVSVATGGTQASAVSNEPAISADGRYVAFASSSPNMVPRDTNGTSDVFVRDRVTGVTTRVSLATGGAQARSHSALPAISANGRYIAFPSLASNLVAGDTNGTNDVFVRDRVAGVTTRVSLATGGTQANGESQVPMISADGRYVAFQSGARNLVAGDTNGLYDVFVRDRVSGVTTRVSVASGSTQAKGHSFEPAISADGRYVAFGSWASNLVTGDTNSAADVFVRDRLAPARVPSSTPPQVVTPPSGGVGTGDGSTATNVY